MRRYPGRPGASPVVAALYAAKVIRPSHVVLDVGGGNGNDAVALAQWGVREVHVIDVDEAAVDRVSRRVNCRVKQLRVGAVELHYGSITVFHDCFAREQFDVIIDMLCWSNIRPKHRPGYSRQAWEVLKPGGLFVLQARCRGPLFRASEPEDLLPDHLRRRFAFWRGVRTHLAEYPASERRSSFVLTTVFVGRRRHRVLPNRPTS